MTRASLGGTALAAIQRVVAIVGCQRSGTTLTGQIFGAHPQALLIDEFDGLYPWFAARATDAADADHLAHAMLANAMQKYHTPSERFTNGRPATDVCAAVPTLILKAPNLTYDDDRLARLGVPVTILYPVRDPRAVVASMGNLPEVPFVENQLRLIAVRPAIARSDEASVRTMRDDAAPMYVRQAAMWKLKSGRSEALVAAGLNVEQFRYEAFVADAPAHIDRLLRACALEPVPEVYAPERSYVGFGPGGTDRTRAIDAASLATWRGRLDDEQQRAIMRAAAPLAERFGYAA